MGPARGRDHPALIDRLWEEGHAFDFFQAVRVLQRWAARTPRDATAPPASPLGGDHAPQSEAVRLRAVPSLSFPAASVAEVRRGRPRAPDGSPGQPEMLVTFMGLIGPQGVLPEHYTSLVIERARAKDYALREFLDLFHHRALSLFFRAWEKYRFAFGYEAGKGDITDLPPSGPEDVPHKSVMSPFPAEDLFTWCLYCLVGLGTAGLRRRMAVDDETLLYYGGLFAGRARSAVPLEIMLADYLDLPVEVRQFQGQWLYLSPEDRSLLPGGAGGPGQNNALGKSVVIGERVWDVQSRFRVRVGPLDYAGFRRFLPDGDRTRPLCELVRAYAGPQWDFDLQPVLRAAEVPWCRLGGDGADASRLGWNTWVRSRPLDHDASDAVFSWDK